LVNLIIKSFTGQSYELTSRSNPSRSSSAKRYSSDSYSTFRFVATLPLAPAQWVQILKSTHQRLPDFHSSHPGEVYQAVAEAIVRGDLSLYQLPSMNANHCLAGKKGFGLSIIKGPKPHSATDLSPESIKTAASAQQLLAELGISNEAFLGYLSGENLYNSYQKRNPLVEAFGLLATGELLAYKIPLPPKTPSVKAQEFLPVTAADRPVPLAPESSGKPEQSKKESSIIDDSTQFKRIHEDGSSEDPYTLQADGKPLGAQEGVMPISALGLEELPENHDHLVEQGFPNLKFERAPGEFCKDYANFCDARPDVLPPGTTLYRILDEQANPAGAYWATALPESKATWRGNYAVKDSWNDNGYYTEYTVPPGDGLKVWRGTTAGQEYREHNGKEFFLKGGKEQLFISPNTIDPAPKKLTPWKDATA